MTSILRRLQRIQEFGNHLIFLLTDLNTETLINSEVQEIDQKDLNLRLYECIKVVDLIYNLSDEEKIIFSNQMISLRSNLNHWILAIKGLYKTDLLGDHLYTANILMNLSSSFIKNVLNVLIIPSDSVIKRSVESGSFIVRKGSIESGVRQKYMIVHALANGESYLSSATIKSFRKKFCLETSVNNIRGNAYKIFRNDLKRSSVIEHLLNYRNLSALSELILEEKDPQVIEFWNSINN